MTTSTFQFPQSCFCDKKHFMDRKKVDFKFQGFEHREKLKGQLSNTPQWM